MVVIECPHCDEDLEMDDGAYGLFECPYCGGEYEWGEKPKSTRPKTTRSLDLSKLKKKSSTKSLESRTKIIDKRKQYSNQKNVDLLEYGGFQVSTLFATFVMLTLIFTALNSDEWYTADWWEEYDSDERDACDLSEGTGSGETWSFGTSAVFQEEVRDTRSGSCWDEPYDGEEYERNTYDGTEYATVLIQTTEYIEQQEDYCENVLEWMDSGEQEEFEEQCEDDLEQLGEVYDWYNSWDNAGTVIQIFMVISFIFCLFILSVKTYLLLQQIGIINSSPDLIQKISTYDNLLSSIMAGFIVMGLILYWLVIPDFNHLFRLNENWEEPDDYSYGLGMIWWSLMIFSLIYIAISVFAMGKKASRN